MAATDVWHDLKVVPVHDMKSYGGLEFVTPLILKFGTKWERAVLLPTPRLLHNRGNSPRYPLIRRKDGFQSQIWPLRRLKFCFPCHGRTTIPRLSSPLPSHFTNLAIPATDWHYLLGSKTICCIKCGNPSAVQNLLMIPNKPPPPST